MECDIASYHIESFNFLIDPGIRLAALDVPPIKFRFENGDNVEISYTSAILDKPNLKTKSLDVVKLYPSECRQRGLTYAGVMKVGVRIAVNGMEMQELNVEAGRVPIMLRSNLCHLAGLDEKNLIKKNEEPLERGGYFVCKGAEKVVRLLIANRSNYPYAINRESYKKKGKFFTEYGVMMRSVRGMHSVAMNTLHFLSISSMTITIQYRREIFYVPFMYVLRALVDYNEYEIYEKLLRGRTQDDFYASCIRNMIRNARNEGVVSRETALKILGSRFRVCVGDRIAPWETDEDAAKFIFKYCLCIHLDSDVDKFYCLAYMAKKLMAHVNGEILPESPDSPQFQEASVSGHIVLAIIRERLENQLANAKTNLIFMERKQGEKFKFTEQKFIQAWGTQKNGEITKGLEYFLATGTLVTKTGLGLMQTTGFSVIAERINQLRFVSHFRAVHRGSFFTEMRTTDARKLRPEAWGFICPVHTPDGAPCGLLNHITASTRIVNSYQGRISKIQRTLADLGVVPNGIDDVALDDEGYQVLVDGNFIGYISKTRAPIALQHLRKMKVSDSDTRMPSTAELTLVKYSSDPENVLTQYPGLYIFTNPGRFIRPVMNLYHQVVEYVGTFEQVYLSIIIDPKEADPGVTMHQELHPSTLFSFAGNLIPFPDHNQSPRNVYQCQMGKQTMGTAVHAWHARNDNKMYRLLFPQSPLLKPEAYDLYKMDNYPLGTNACVAVISYTGYDMEDAMVINKSSYERGFAHGTVIKVEVADLNEKNRYATMDTANIFGRDPDAHDLDNYISEDGLPIPGKLYREHDPYMSFKAADTQKYVIKKFHYAEPAICGYVRVVEANEDLGKTKALIQWRISRNPIIGDKFASRHGQKGINSFLWPQESLPFSESGMVPDIIFNPHGFPSRMTIGMMIESMAGKAGAMQGKYLDASPFVFNESNTAIDYFGELLQKSGYNYFGEETFYSGTDGREMKAQIFFGIVYYQRLRHMISDKFQVRGTGPVDSTTMQPVKGRKKGGGIRFGEMERDSLIAHGAAFCLQDRLLLSSDVDYSWACKQCGSLVSVIKTITRTKIYKAREYSCRICKTARHVERMQVPHIFSYLAAELGAMNIKMTMSVKDPIKE